MKNLNILFIILTITTLKTYNIDIFSAIKRSPDLTMIDELYAQNPNIFQTTNKFKQTPLMLAIEQNNIPFATRLIDKYPDKILINEQDKNGNTALHHAINNQLFTITADLIRAGANLDVQNNLGQTPLHLAFEKQDSDIAYLLLLNKANPNICDIKKRTPLHILARHLQNEEINSLLLDELLKLGADINAQDQLKQTPLHLALISHSKNTLGFFDRYSTNHINFAKLLIDHHANANLTDFENNTPLHIAILFHQPNETYTEIISKLIPKTNLTIKNSDQETPADMVKKFKKTDLYSLFSIPITKKWFQATNYSAAGTLYSPKLSPFLKNQANQINFWEALNKNKSSGSNDIISTSSGN